MLELLALILTNEVLFSWLGKFAGALTTIGTISGALYKWVWTPLKKVKSEWDTLVNRMQSFEVDLKKVKDEFSPNGGSTLRDSIDRIEKKMITMDQQQRAMLDNDERAVFVTNDAGLCIWVNRSFLSMIGYTLSEVIGHGWKNAIPEHMREKVVDEWNNAVIEKRDFNMKFSYEHKNGNLVQVEKHADLLTAPDGKVLGHFGIIKRRVLPIENHILREETTWPGLLKG